jgi:FHS family L-fucose permease-like MFS transporter
MAISTNNNNISSQAIKNKKANYKPALALLTSLFFMWGFITCLNDILIPHLKALFDMNYTMTMLIQFTFFGAYFVMSLPAGWLVGKIGYKKGIILGLIITGIGALLFFPASTFISYGMFLGGFFVLASGITVLQVAANPYVAILGSPETASSRLNLTQAFNSLGTTVAPIFGSMLILANNVENATEKAATVQVPYFAIAATLFVIAAIFIFAKLPIIKEQKKIDSIPGSAWQYRHLILGAIAIFVYVGAEVSIGSFMINFFSMDYIAGLSETDAAKYVALYWGGAMLGRFFGAVSMSDIKSNKKNIYTFLIAIFSFLLAWYITAQINLAAIFFIFVILNIVAVKISKNKANKTLAIFAIAALGLVILTVLLKGEFAMWTLVAVGLFNSIMFPTIFTLSINGLGKHTSQGSGILVMAIVGGALIPLIMGGLADTIGLHSSFLITIICYAYIVYFGLKGYKNRVLPRIE